MRKVIDLAKKHFMKIYFIILVLGTVRIIYDLINDSPNLYIYLLAFVALGLVLSQISAYLRSERHVSLNNCMIILREKTKFEKVEGDRILCDKAITNNRTFVGFTQIINPKVGYENADINEYVSIDNCFINDDLIEAINIIDDNAINGR